MPPKHFFCKILGKIYEKEMSGRKWEEKEGGGGIDVIRLAAGLRSLHA